MFILMFAFYNTKMSPNKTLSLPQSRPTVEQVVEGTVPQTCIYRNVKRFIYFVHSCVAALGGCQAA